MRLISFLLLLTFASSKDLVSYKPFIISYAFLMKNEIPVGEKYNISIPITPKVSTTEYSCRINIKSPVSDDEEHYLKKLLQEHKNDVVNCLQKTGVSIRSDEIRKELATKTQTVFRIPPTRVHTWLDNGFLIIDVQRIIK